MNTKTIGENIRYFRKIKGLTQAELANKIQRSSNLVARWERNEIQPKAENIPLLTTALEITSADLLGEKRDEVTQSPTPDYAYWGAVVNKMQQLAKNGNTQEIEAIRSLLKIGFDALMTSNKPGINMIQQNIGDNNRQEVKF